MRRVRSLDALQADLDRFYVLRASTVEKRLACSDKSRRNVTSSLLSCQFRKPGPPYMRPQLPPTSGRLSLSAVACVCTRSASCAGRRADNGPGRRIVRTPASADVCQHASQGAEAASPVGRSAPLAKRRNLDINHRPSCRVDVRRWNHRGLLLGQSSAALASAAPRPRLSAPRNPRSRANAA
jgi:hypothetical protein